MENRKALHDYSLLLVFLAVLNLFSFLSSVVGSIIDGTIDKALATADSDILVAVKVVLIIIAALMAVIAFSDAFIGFKGLKISREPKADKGYIIAAKVFMVINVLATIFAIVALANGSTPIIDGILNLACVVTDVFAYILFIKAATKVRKEVIEKA